MKQLFRCMPNMLSMFRLLAAPVTAGLIVKEQFFAALGVFVLAGLSDALDGYLARLYALTSRFGALLDPVADKLLMLLCYAALADVAVIPWWLAAVVIGRDFLIVCGLALLQLWHIRMDIRPLMIGKLTTVMQVCFVVLILFVHIFAGSVPLLRGAGAAIVCLFTLWSMLAYAGVWGRAVTTRHAGVS